MEIGPLPVAVISPGSLRSECRLLFSPPTKTETPEAYRMISHLQYLDNFNAHVHISSIIIYAVPNRAFEWWIL